MLGRATLRPARRRLHDETTRSPSRCWALRTSRAIAAGDSTPARCSYTGTVQCWGANTPGQLGDGTTNRPTTPTAVGRALGRHGARGGRRDPCARLSSGDIKCWGNAAGTGTGVRRVHSHAPWATSHTPGPTTSASCRARAPCSSRSLPPRADWRPRHPRRPEHAPLLRRHPEPDAHLRPARRGGRSLHRAVRRAYHGVQ